MIWFELIWKIAVMGSLISIGYWMRTQRKWQEQQDRSLRHLLAELDTDGPKVVREMDRD